MLGLLAVLLTAKTLSDFTCCRTPRLHPGQENPRAAIAVAFDLDLGGAEELSPFLLDRPPAGAVPSPEIPLGPLGMLLPKPPEDALPGERIDVRQRPLAGVVAEVGGPSPQYRIEQGEHRPQVQ